MARLRWPALGGGGWEAAEAEVPAADRGITPDRQKSSRTARQTSAPILRVSKKETIDKIYADLDEEPAANTSSATLPTSPTPPPAITSSTSLVKQKDAQSKPATGFYLDR